MLDGSQDSEHLFKIKPEVVTKWQATGLLEGLETAKAEKMAMLLENQAVWFLRAGEEVQKAHMGIVFPLVRRVFQEFYYDVTITPAYIGTDSRARTVEVIDPKCSIYSLSHSDLTEHD